MADKLTPKNQASFVRDLIDYDLQRHGWSSEEKLDYLKIVGDHVDDVGEDILSAPPPLSGPEHVAEIVSDVQKILGIPDTVSSRLAIANELFELTRPEGYDALNPVQFLKSAECLKGDDAQEWLYRRKYVETSDHIHVFPNDLCLDLSTRGNPRWIEPDSIRMVGSIVDVILAMYEAYREGSNET